MFHHCHIDSEDITDIIISLFQIPWSSCFGRKPPSSPNIEAQEGELETLLVGNYDGWDDPDEFQLITPRGIKERQSKNGKQQPKATNMKKPFTSPIHQPEDSLSYKSHLNRSRPVSGYSEFSNEIDEDAKSLSINPTKLAEMAKQFEPNLTLDDIKREEEEQAERDRLEEVKSGFDVIVPPKKIREDGQSDEIDQEEEFGEFEEANNNGKETSAGNDRSFSIGAEEGEVVQTSRGVRLVEGGDEAGSIYLG